MNAAALIDRLDDVKQTGASRWLARCPAHDDKRASLSIRELDDGRILIHCFAGCGADEIVAAFGLDLSDLFPERAMDHRRSRETRPFPAADVLRAVAFEILVSGFIAADIARGHPMTKERRARLFLASSRLLAAVDVAGLDIDAARLRRQLAAARRASSNLDQRAAAIHAA